MALEQIQGKPKSLTPEELDRLALQYKPSWEVDELPLAAPVAASAQSNGNGAAARARAMDADKPKASPSASALRPVSLKVTTPPQMVEPAAAAPETPAPVASVEAPAAEPTNAPVEATAAEPTKALVEGTSAAAVVSDDAVKPTASPSEDAVAPADVTAPKESADAAPNDAAPPEAEVAEEADVVEADALPDPPAPPIANRAEPANANAEERPPTATPVAANDDMARMDAAMAEPPLDEIPMQRSSSGTILKVMFALVAVLGLVFVGKGMLGGPENDKPKPATNAQATTAPQETVVKPGEPSPPPTEAPKATAGTAQPAKTEEPKTEAPKADAKTAEPPKVDPPKAEAPKTEPTRAESPKPVVTATAATKATVGVSPTKPPTTVTPKPTTTATAKTGGGIIRETPF